MKKKIKWAIIGISVIMIAAIAYLTALVRYAQNEAAALNDYVISLESMPEVETVHSIHRFNGLESYVVARVSLTDNPQDVYFFVRDRAVQHHIGSHELIAESQATSIALNLITEGTLHRIQLGILEETPIFEVQVASDGQMYYVVIDAISGHVIMTFDL